MKWYGKKEEDQNTDMMDKGGAKVTALDKQVIEVALAVEAEAASLNYSAVGMRRNKQTKMFEVYRWEVNPDSGKARLAELESFRDVQDAELHMKIRYMDEYIFKALDKLEE